MMRRKRTRRKKSEYESAESDEYEDDEYEDESEEETPPAKRRGSGKRLDHAFRRGLGGVPASTPGLPWPTICQGGRMLLESGRQTERPHPILPGATTVTTRRTFATMCLALLAAVSCSNLLADERAEETRSHADGHAECRLQARLGHAQGQSALAGRTRDDRAGHLPATCSASTSTQDVEHAHQGAARQLRHRDVLHDRRSAVSRRGARLPVQRLGQAEGARLSSARIRRPTRITTTSPIGT